MKTRLFLILVLIGTFFTVPGMANPTGQGGSNNPGASGITDEELDYQSRRDGEIARPRSIEVPLLKGVISYTNQVITNTFFFNLGEVTFQIIDAGGNAVLTRQAFAVSGGKVTLDLSGLAPGKYDVVCYIIDEAPQVASFIL